MIDRVKIEYLLDQLRKRCDPVQQFVVSVRFPEDIGWSTEQHFLVLHLMLILDLIDTLPLWLILLLPHQAAPDELLGLAGREINVLEKQAVLAEIAEDVGVSRWVLK